MVLKAGISLQRRRTQAMFKTKELAFLLVVSSMFSIIIAFGVCWLWRMDCVDNYTGDRGYTGHGLIHFLGTFTWP